MRTTTKDVGRLVAVFLLCCGVGCGGGGGGAGGEDSPVSLLQTEAVPGQVITVRDTRIQEGDVVEVVFGTPDGDPSPYSAASYGLASENGEVQVATPMAADLETGLPAARDLVVVINGQAAPRRMSIDAPVQMTFASEGVVLAAFWDLILNNLEATIDNLRILQSREGADSTALGAQIDAASLEFQRVLAAQTELVETGQITIGSGENAQVLTPEELTNVDELLLASLVGRRAYLDALDGAEVESKFGVPIDGKGGVSKARIRQSMAEASNTLRGTDLTKGGRQVALDFVDDVIPKMERDSEQGAGQFFSWLSTSLPIVKFFGGRGASDQIKAVRVGITVTETVYNGSTTLANSEETDLAALGWAKYEELKRNLNAFARQARQAAVDAGDSEYAKRLRDAYNQMFETSDVTSDAVDTECQVGGDESPICATRSNTIGNITGLGFASASSQFNDDFSVRNATDGNNATNWFSNGGRDNNLEVLEWTFTGAGDVPVFRIETDAETFRDNDPDTDDNFGFRVVVISIKNAADSLVHESSAIYPPGGRVDIRHALPGGIRAKKITIQLIDHVQADCGGVSELRIFGKSN